MEEGFVRGHMDRVRRGRAWRARVLAAAAVAAIAGAALAQESENRIGLPPLVVEGARLEPDRRLDDEEARREIERTPGGVAVVGRETIGKGRAANLKDALDFVPGVMVRPRFGAADESQISIRGSGLRNNFHLRGLNVLIDGFPYGNADGFSDFETLELLATRRLEVYKGANALRFGANSLGGALNLVTKTGYDAAPVELRSEGGSFGFHKHYGATGQVRGPWDVYAGFADTELDGFRDHAEQVRRRAWASLGYAGAEGRSARVDLAWARNGENLPGSLTREELERDPTQANAQDVTADSQRDYDYARTGVTLRTPLGVEQVAEVGLHASLQDQFHPLSFAILTGDTWSWSVEPRWILAAPLLGRPNRLTAGVQYAQTLQEDVRYENLGGARKGAVTRDQENEALNVGLYVEEQHDWTPALALVLGGRFQYARRSVDDRRGGPGESTDFFSFAPKVGFVYRLGAGTQLFGNVSRAVEPPLILELASPAAIDGSLDDLDAQDSWQLEIGSRGRLGPRVEWDVAVFDVELRDEIRNVNVQPFPGAPFTIPRFTNIDRSRHLGIEAGGDVRLAEGLVSAAGDVLRWRTAYTWSRFRFVGDSELGDNQLPGAPEHFVRSELRWDHPAGVWIAPGTEAVPAAYAVDSGNTAETDAYALLGVRAGLDVARWRLSLFVEGRNLLDETWVSSVQVDNALGRFFEPGDARAFYGGLEWRWG